MFAKGLGMMIVCLLLFAGCTIIGTATLDDLKRRDFGGEETLRICIYKDTTVSDTQAEKMIAALREEFLPFGVKVEVPWVQDWQRPSLVAGGIIDDIATRPLESPCDRLFGMVGRDWRDLVWGMILPEILGVVDSATMTKGYAVAEWGSLNQVLSLRSPENLMVHETYHLLGCGHGLNAGVCYDQILRIKKAAKKNREEGQDFFPSMTPEGKIVWTRDGVDRILGELVKRSAEGIGGDQPVETQVSKPIWGAIEYLTEMDGGH